MRDLCPRPLHGMTARLSGALMALAAALLFSGGCESIGFLAQGLGGEDDKPAVPPVEPQYLGMTNKSVAVLVSADERSSRYPDAARNVCLAVSQQLTRDVTGVKPMDPDEVMKFINRNPTWIAVPPPELIKLLKVERLLIIDLAHYTTHEPGNRHVWRGNILARVEVVEAEAPLRVAFAESVTVEFPPDRPVGVLNADDETIQLGMLRLFAYRVSGRFRDHEKKK